MWVCEQIAEYSFFPQEAFPDNVDGFDQELKCAFMVVTSHSFIQSIVSHGLGSGRQPLPLTA